jgi:patatin-like phospholipase/acyl hydrolase
VTIGARYIAACVNLAILDGCGTLGYAQLLILNALMHRIQREEGLKEAPRPCDRLDLIGGTGMGGLVAILEPS